MLFMTIALLIGITLAGVDLSVLAVFSGAIGLGVGFGLQRGVSNLFTGLMLLMDKTVQPGDVLELDNGVLGTVKQMGSRCTEILTFDRKSHLIPNEELVTKPVVNWSRAGLRGPISVNFGVAYKHNPHDIIAMAKDVAAGIDRALTDPAPNCVMTGFGDSAMNFNLSLWVENPHLGSGEIKSAMFLGLWDAFKANNISIPYPHRFIVQENKD